MNENRIPDEQDEFFAVTMFGRRVTIEWSSEPPVTDDGCAAKCRVFADGGRIVLWRALSPDDTALLLASAMGRIAETWAAAQAVDEINKITASIPGMMKAAVEQCVVKLPQA